MEAFLLCPLLLTHTGRLAHRCLRELYAQVSKANRMFFMEWMHSSYCCIKYDPGTVAATDSSWSWSLVLQSQASFTLKQRGQVSHVLNVINSRWEHLEGSFFETEKRWVQTPWQSKTGHVSFLMSSVPYWIKNGAMFSNNESMGYESQPLPIAPSDLSTRQGRGWDNPATHWRNAEDILLIHMEQPDLLLSVYFECILSVYPEAMFPTICMFCQNSLWERRDSGPVMVPPHILYMHTSVCS